MSLVGPLAGWELLRLGRSGALPRARVVLALTMLVGLGLAYSDAVRNTWQYGQSSGDVSIARASRVAANYLIAYLVVQILAVVVLTPVVAAGAISDEKERGRLDFLRSSMLSPHEIILGKYLGRVLYLLGILATGLPILALSTLFGGVDLELLAAGTVVTVTSVFALAAYSTALAVRRANLREVMLVAYLNLTVTTVAGLCCGWIPGMAALSPITALLYAIATRDNDLYFVLQVGSVVVVHAIIAVTYLRSAVRDLTAMSGAPPLVAEVPAWESPDGLPEYPDKPQPQDSAPPNFPPRERAFVPMMADDDDPFAWKERHFAPRYAGGVTEAVRGCFVLAGAAVIFTVAVLAITAVSRRLDRGANLIDGFSGPAAELAQLLSTGATVLLMLLLATRTATSVASERERDALTPLLVLPVERHRILWAKWLAPLRWSRYVLIAVVVVELSAAVGGDITVVATVVVLAQVSAAVVLANTLGLWFSVTCQTATRASAYSLLALLTLTVAPLLGGFAAFSPPAGVWLAHERPVSAVVPVALQLLATAGLGWHAVRRFERYGK
jgi:ABC-type transport system involved in multi-copper enzyme maturation permease subunit